MKRFLILFYGGLHTDGMNADEKQQHLYRWGQYLAYFSQNDQLISGSPLSSNGMLMTQNGAFKMVDENQLQGYMLLQAKSYKEVEKLLENCPALEGQANKIEIRELQPNVG